MAKLWVISVFSSIVLVGSIWALQTAGTNSPDPQVFRVGNGVSPPRVVSTPDPNYSEEARQRRVEGHVVLWLIVDESGMPADIKVARTLGYGLDEEAIKAVKQWRFSPATKDGKPVKVQINVDVKFQLTAKPPKEGRIDFSHSTPSVSTTPIDIDMTKQNPVVPIKTVKPEYPQAAAQDQKQGQVIVKVVIDEKGNVIDAQFVSGDPVFETAAIAAAKKWTFQPFMKNGEAKKVAVRIPFNFAFSDKISNIKRAPAEDKRTDLPPGVSAGMLIHRVTPVYPVSAKLNRVQGSVSLNVVISKDGTVKDIRLLAGPSELVQAAIDAVEQWRYRPYLQDGQPVDVSTTVQVNFSLR